MGLYIYNTIFKVYTVKMYEFSIGKFIIIKNFVTDKICVLFTE